MKTQTLIALALGGCAAAALLFALGRSDEASAEPEPDDDEPDVEDEPINPEWMEQQPIPFDSLVSTDEGLTETVAKFIERKMDVRQLPRASGVYALLHNLHGFPLNYDEPYSWQTIQERFAEILGEQNLGLPVPETYYASGDSITGYVLPYDQYRWFHHMQGLRVFGPKIWYDAAASNYERRP